MARWTRFRSRLPGSAGHGAGEQELTARRRQMVEQQIAARGVRDPDLLRAFATVRRHAFVDPDEAYEDRALPVGEGQTISQPYIVALMTAAARPGGGYHGAKVLEVGTGSGYQAAILAELGAEMVSIERYPELSERAAALLRQEGYPNVRLLVGDGTRGWPSGAPYDAVIVTAAGPSLPEPLVEQLSPDGGRLVMPVGSRAHQVMTLVERRPDGVFTRQMEECAFVPLIGAFGWRGDRPA